jgi:hypothetical protein
VPKATRTKAIGRTPLETLARAALDYRRAIMDAAAELGPSPPREEKQKIRRRLSMADDLLHRVVVAFSDGEAGSMLVETAALNIDGTLIVADPDDECDDGFRIHILEPSEVTAVG